MVSSASEPSHLTMDLSISRKITQNGNYPWLASWERQT
uniref:Uncharacterized protein n=1 Tax=Rhizophora mucronata TaxID=61149 RepID=A0A2P2Q8Z1_RHIMU